MNASVETNDTYRIGIDVGGTFTDVVLVDDRTGAVRVAKVLNSHADRADTVLSGIRRLLDETGIPSRKISYIGHGTTITTNAVIERKGARTALITNKGFRDILEIGRFGRPPELIYRVHEGRPDPYVDRELRVGVPCRITADGEVAADLDMDELARLVGELKAKEVEAIAVCFLFSFLNPVHEEQVRDYLTEHFPGAHVVLSSDILREFREYPRTSTTVFAAYVAPVLRRYVASLVDKLSSSGIGCPLYIFQSNGGIARPEVVMRNPALTLLSGPSGAVVGGAQLCAAAGFSNLITMDIGGTSLDICVVHEGQFDVTKAREIDMQPVAVPMLNIHTVGAGGGSIIRVDEVGRVSVGPDSVAANPGPACYGRGGTLPTLTDVNVTLGLINPDTFAQGALKLDRAAAEAALLADIGRPLGLDAAQAAVGVYRVATNQIAESVQKATIEKGVDPRDFTIVAFGGGGPLHACAAAREVGIRTVLVPMHPGLFSARGIALSDFYHDYVQSRVEPLDGADLAALDRQFGVLGEEALRDLDAEEIGEDRRRILRSLDLRYLGQSSEINIPLDEGGIDLGALRERFHAAHEALYSYRVDGEPLEIVNLRLRAVGTVDKPTLRIGGSDEADGKPQGVRTVLLPGTGVATDVPVYMRTNLMPGAAIEGPALIEEVSSTTFMPERSRGRVDQFHNLVIEVEP